MYGFLGNRFSIYLNSRMKMFVPSLRTADAEQDCFDYKSQFNLEGTA